MKAGLIKEAATFRTQHMTVRVGSEFKPRSVWAKEGYDISKIEVRREKRDNPVLGEVWAAPLTAVVHEDIRGQVEKEINLLNKVVVDVCLPNGTHKLGMAGPDP